QGHGTRPQPPRQSLAQRRHGRRPIARLADPAHGQDQVRNDRRLFAPTGALNRKLADRFGYEAAGRHGIARFRRKGYGASLAEQLDGVMDDGVRIVDTLPVDHLSHGQTLALASWRQTFFTVRTAARLDYSRKISCREGLRSRSQAPP